MSDLSYTVRGSLEHQPVLFLHGFMGAARDWETIADGLHEGFYFVSVDLPGHGASTGLSPGNYTIEGAAGGLIQVLDELGVGRASVVGYSMGGRLALYFALRYPERCNGLFLESASPGLESGEERQSRIEIDEQRANRLESGDFEEFLRDWYRQRIFASLAKNEELLRQSIQSRSLNNPQDLARSLRGMGTGSQPSLWDELDGLQVATLTVAGELDEKFSGIGRRMEGKSPMVGFVSVPEVGHNVHLEAPGAYIGLLRNFLESL